LIVCVIIGYYEKKCKVSLVQSLPFFDKGYTSSEAAMIAAIICGFPVCKNYGRIGLDEKYYEKWRQVHFEGHSFLWMRLYWEIK
jgi:hypothetical protein